MRFSRYTLLLAGFALAVTACSKKTVIPEFDMLAIDTLIGSAEQGYQIEYRFTTIQNAKKSPALEMIEKSNIGYFFELETFDGTPREAADSAIRQYAAELTSDGELLPSQYNGEISAESEAAVIDTLLSYTITRSSFTGGAHGMYGIECHTYSLTGGYELSTADLFSERQLLGMESLLRKKLYEQYDTDSDNGLAEKGFFPEDIALTENFQITPEGITFYYNPYAIGCYALGAVDVTISKEELSAL